MLASETEGVTVVDSGGRSAQETPVRQGSVIGLKEEERNDGEEVVEVYT